MPRAMPSRSGDVVGDHDCLVAVAGRGCRLRAAVPERPRRSRRRAGHWSCRTGWTDASAPCASTRWLMRTSPSGHHCGCWPACWKRSRRTSSPPTTMIASTARRRLIAALRAACCRATPTQRALTSSSLEVARSFAWTRHSSTGRHATPRSRRSSKWSPPSSTLSKRTRRGVRGPVPG